MNKRVKSKISCYNFLPENHRGQVTIFIIIAIIIIVCVVLYFVFRESFNIDKIPSEVEPVYTHIISCLEETTEEGVEYLGLHGGYYEVPMALSIAYFIENIPYYYVNSREYVPTIERIEGELENYVYDSLINCLDFENFKESGYDINSGDLLVSTNIKENEIKIKLDYPLTITKGDSTKRLGEFESSIETNIPYLIEISQEIVDSYSEKPGFVCLTCLEEITEENNEVQITSAPFSNQEENSIFFLITSYETELKWKFAVET